MGNTCCSDEKRVDGTKANIKGGVNIGTNKPGDKFYYKNPSYQSKIDPKMFSSIPSQDKDIILAEAFKMLLTTVEPGKVNSTNPTVKSLLTKTTGRAVNSAGDVYDGELVDGVPNGKGVITYTNGSIYEGNVFNGKEHGQGKFITKGPTPYSFSGEFYNGIPVGIVNSKTQAGKDNGAEIVGCYDPSCDETGPYMCNFPSGEMTYFRQKNSRVEGTWVLISKDRKEVTVREYLQGEQQGKDKVFMQLAPPTTATTTTTAPAPAPAPVLNAPKK